MRFFKSKPPKKTEHDQRKERAAERNREAKKRFDEALKRLKPIKDISDFLGDA